MFKDEYIELPQDLYEKAKYLFADEVKIVEKNKKRKSYWVALLLLIFICSPLVILIFNLFNSFFNLYSLNRNIKNQEFSMLGEKANSLSNNLGINLKLTEMATPVFAVFGQEEKIHKVQNLIVFGQSLTESLRQISQVTTDGGVIFKEVLSGENNLRGEDVVKLSQGLQIAFEKTSFAQGLLNNFSGDEPFVGSYLKQAKIYLPELRDNLLMGSQLLELTPELLGEKGRKTYLVLFQNNSEIRPSGGFIGSYGLITFEKGKLLDFEINDVYFADGQLKGHVEPPALLKKYLGTAGWYLRDSNWDPDFPTSAQRAQWFLDKEIGRSVDGVIGINLAVAQRLLEAVGPIQLPDYQEQITGQNFFEKAEYYSEKGFFPGSTGKQDFLGQVGRILLEKIKNSDEKSLMMIGKAIIVSLNEKDLTMYFSNKGLSLFASKFNWDGALKKITCENKGKCFEDYLNLVEANIGVNKSNYFLKRTIDQKVQITKKGSVSDLLIITYENKSPSDVFPSGKYRTYLRIFVPEGAQLTKCRIENVDCFPDQTIEHERSVFGMLVEVPIKEKRKVEIAYNLVGSVTDEYLFYFQKQPGVGKDDLSLNISYPENLNLRLFKPPKKSFFLPFPQESLTGRGLVVYNTQILSDFVVSAKFQLK